MKTYPIQLDDNLHAALRLKAAEMRVTIREVVLTALRAIVAQKGTEK